MPLPPFLRRTPSAPAPAPEATPETARSQARRRLIGAVVLLGVGVIAFPLLFETEPRPIPVDLPIVIPPRETAPPLAMPPPASAARADAPAPVVAAEPPSAAPAPEPVTAQKAEPADAAKAESRPEPSPDPKTDATAASAKPPPSDDGARARALLEGKAAEFGVAPPHWYAAIYLHVWSWAVVPMAGAAEC